MCFFPRFATSLGLFSFRLFAPLRLLRCVLCYLEKPGLIQHPRRGILFVRKTMEREGKKSDRSDVPSLNLGPLGSLLPPSLKKNRPLSPSSDPLLVSLLDGTLIAVEPTTGAPLWAFDSGSPLVSSGGLGGGRRQDGGGGDGGTSNEGGAALVPGVDGSLYAYAPAEAAINGGGGGRGLARLPTGVADLVDASPSLAADGRTVVLGGRRTTVFVLDPASGALRRAFATGDYDDDDDEDEGGVGEGAGAAAAAAAARERGTDESFLRRMTKRRRRGGRSRGD